MSRATTLPTPWRELAERAGGVQHLAEALETLETTQSAGA